MIFSDGSYIPTFIIFSAIGIIKKCAPVEYPLFHKSFPFHSYYGFRFSLPVDINEKNWPHIKSIGSMIFFVKGLTCMNVQPSLYSDNNKISVLADLDATEQPFVNVHINNISFPTSLEELETFVYEHQRYNVEEILCGFDVSWTIPRSAKIGDIVEIEETRPLSATKRFRLVKIVARAEDVK